MKLKLFKDWECVRDVLKPGVYAVPGEISETHARCAIADGAGAFEDASEGEKPSQGKKRGRPRKALSGAPENKA